MIVCPKCAKENQDHYKFCLGCGTMLRDVARRVVSPAAESSGVAPPPVAPIAAATAAPPAPSATVPDPALAWGSPAAPVPAPAPAPTVPEAAPAWGATALAPAPAVLHAPAGPVPEPAPVAVAATVAAAPAPDEAPGCPECGHVNPAQNRFCASCGFRIVAQVAAAAAVPAVAAPAQATEPQLRVVLTALRPDGAEAGTFAFAQPEGSLGRDSGGIFAGDPYLSPRHATFSLRQGRLFVRDEGSLNGVYRRLARNAPVPLRFGDTFRIGQELLRLEALVFPPPTPDGVQLLGSPVRGAVGRIALVLGPEVSGNAYLVPDTGLQLGREVGEVLFPEDGYVSGTHCRIGYQPPGAGQQGGTFFLTDLGSSNGTYLRLAEETELLNGDILLMGQQLYRLTF